MKRNIKCMAIALLMAAGCQYRLPPGYVEVEPSYHSNFRAVSAEGCALTLRTEDNPKNGDLGFWEKAIQSRLVGVGGYQQVSRQEVMNDKTPGVEILYDYLRPDAAFNYMLTVFVKGGRVYVIEAAGTRERMAQDLPNIREAIQTWPL